VDPGGDVARVLGMAQPGGFTIRRIFCTHGHPDHVAGVARTQALTRAAVSLHRADEPWLEAFPEISARYGLDAAEPPTVDRWHEHGETFELGEQRAVVLHTPGHSAGSCCLLFPDAGVLFTGDTLFSGSVGRTDLPGGDLDALIGSIRDRVFAVGDAVRFHPGHGSAGLVGDERRLNPFAGEPALRGRFP
jgi:glyoxylase-like metal-dependent hydrolase (beta-lactamase superfamily II)